MREKAIYALRQVDLSSYRVIAFEASVKRILTMRQLMALHDAKHTVIVRVPTFLLSSLIEAVVIEVLLLVHWHAARWLLLNGLQACSHAIVTTR